MAPAQLMQSVSAPNPTPKNPVVDFYLSPSDLSSSSNEDENEGKLTKGERSPFKAETSKQNAYAADDKSVIVILQERSHGFLNEYCTSQGQSQGSSQ